MSEQLKKNNNYLKLFEFSIDPWCGRTQLAICYMKQLMFWAVIYSRAIILMYINSPDNW